MKQIFKLIYKKIFPDFYSYFTRDLSDCQSILDLGCGPNSPVGLSQAPRKVAVELFDQYIEESRKKGIHHEYIKEDITKVDFPEKSFDAVVMVDVLEHLSEEDARVLMKKMAGWARKKVIIFTPNGFVHQHHYDENPLQEHKSGWSANQFKALGFKVYGMNGWKALRGELAYLKFKPFYFWMVVSDLTQKVVQFMPSKAYHLYAKKEFR